MAINPDEIDPPKKAQPFLPADLSRHSIHELEALIVTLEGEIQRCKEAITAKRSTRAAAESVFRK